MAANLNGLFPDPLRHSITKSAVLVVGAGGIGCELLKNLVLTGFENIEIIDLDTVDVSNLNRQFLFQKRHVGKSKSQVAQETAQKFNPNVKIVAYHDSITNPDYGLSFFKKFSIVLNALDNRAARNHVNRMCLAADIPLIESGTSGYLGQVSVIKKGLTECYECQPKAAEKSFPGCTIRNTPSEPIHCIVWAKHLFNQLFGEADPDEDVSPDTADPNAAGDAGSAALSYNSNSTGNVERVSTRTWAVNNGYDPQKLFYKLFHDDIRYLLSMDKLWQKRRPPTPLDLNCLPDAVACSSKSENYDIPDQRLWSVQECAEIFADSLRKLKMSAEDLKEGDHLSWDKDNDTDMNFVTACANIRAYIFGISQKTRFDIKSMAGNIIPAIATTNAIIAGLIVMESFKILENRLEDCRTIYLSRQPHPKNKRLLAACKLDRPNKNCYVCSSKPEVSVKLCTGTFTVKMLEDKILKSHLNMVAPDVEIEDGKGTILISSEEGETSGNNEKYLSEFRIRDGSRLKCDDFLQNYNLVLNIIEWNKFDDDKEFEVLGSLPEPKAELGDHLSSNGLNGLIASDTKNDSSDDLLIIEDNTEESFAGKREHEGSPFTEPSQKRMKTDIEETDEVIII